MIWIRKNMESMPVAGMAYARRTGIAKRKHSGDKP